jgi:hypothetical protein
MTTYHSMLSRAASGASRRCRALCPCVGLLFVVACGEKVATPTGADLSEPDLGPDAVVCGSPDDVMRSDDDAAALEGCQIYEGRIRVNGFITDDAPLASLRVVRGSIATSGYDMSVEAIEGFDNVEWVGELHFLGDGLRELSGVANLRKVGGLLRLDSQQSLTSLDGLERLQIVGGSFSIAGNSNLTSLDGLAALERVNGDLSIRDNPKLPREEIDALVARVEVGGEVSVF